jgi:hypothetical protein
VRECGVGDRGEDRARLTVREIGVGSIEVKNTTEKGRDENCCCRLEGLSRDRNALAHLSMPTNECPAIARNRPQVLGPADGQSDDRCAWSGFDWIFIPGNGEQV